MKKKKTTRVSAKKTGTRTKFPEVIYTRVETQTKKDLSELLGTMKESAYVREVLQRHIAMRRVLIMKKRS